MEYAINKMRFERKYLLDRDTALLLRQRMSYVLRPDSSAPAGEYKVSSIYFDDRLGTAFFEKQNGILNREKLRIRYYNDNLDNIQFERKVKHGDMVCKERTPLTLEQYGMMLGGDYDFMKMQIGIPPHGGNDFMKTEASPTSECDTAKEQSPSSDELSPLFERFYTLHLLRCMRPVVVVDYNRLAYMHAPGNVRITFDSAVTAKAPAANYSFSVLPADNVILEVKYDHFLPSHISGLLSGFQLTQQLALSKFVMSKLALR